MPDEPRCRHEVVSDRAAALEFCARMGVTVGDGSDIRGICQTRDGKVIAATLYQDFNGTNLWVHSAGAPGKRWLTKAYLHNIFRYPFVDLKARRISAWVEADNAASRSLCEHIGFQHEGTLREAGRGGVDVIIYAMFRESCRYA